MHTSCCHAQRPASFDAGAASRAAERTERAARAERSERHRCHDDAAAEPSRRAERSHPLVAAMTEALRSLMPAGLPAEQSGELKDSARAFAHELADALRGAFGRGHGPGHGMHGARRGYDDLAQRVDRLAGQLQQPAPAAASSASTTLSASLSSASLNLSVDDNGATASLSMTTLELEVQLQSTGTAATTAESPLLAAFRRLLSALQPDAPATPVAAGADQLGSFLRQLASALRGGPAGSEAPAGASISLAA